MKTPSTDLFLLIKSLNKSEKRHFKLYGYSSDSDKRNTHLKFFEAIDKQKVYNEVLLKRRKELSITNFEKAKRALSNSILRALKSYYSESIFDLTFKNQFNDICVLHQKGLFEQCLKKLQKLKKQSLYYERFTEVIELCRFEKKLSEIIKVDKEEINRTSAIAVEKLATEIKLQQLSDESYEIVKATRHLKEASDVNKIRNILNSPLLSSDRTSLSFLANVAYNKIFIYCHTALKEVETSYKYMELQVKLFEKNPQQMVQYPQQYTSVLHNIMLACIWTGRKKAYTKHLNELKKLENRYRKTGNKYLACQIFENIIFNEFASMQISGEFHKITQVFPDVAEKIRHYSGQLGTPSRQNIYVNIAYSYFGTGDYSNSLVWLNKILELPKISYGQMIQIMSRIMGVVVHYELDHYELLEYIIRSARRFLKKLGMLNEYESCILDFMSEIYTLHNKSEQIELFKLFKQKLTIILEDPKQERPFDGFDIISWIDSKIESRSFAEVVRRKSKSISTS